MPLNATPSKISGENPVNKRFLKDLKLNITNMCQVGTVGWTHALLFITGRGGVSSTEKVNYVNLLI